MRKIFLAFMVFTFMLTSCTNDDDNNKSANEIPNVLAASFQADFGEVKEVEYSKMGDDYEIDFEIAGVDHEAYYTSEGSLIKYKYDILSTELPEAIKSRIEEDFANRKINDAEILVVNGINYYQLEFENEPIDEELVFNEDGSLNTTISYWD